MDISTFIGYVKDLGFPIVMCLVLFYYLVKENEKHKEEVATLSETIGNNTKVLVELSTLIKNLLYNENRKNKARD